MMKKQRKKNNDTQNIQPKKIDEQNHNEKQKEKNVDFILIKSINIGDNNDKEENIFNLDNIIINT